MAKGIRYLIALEKRKRFLEAAGVSENDYFIVSFPKSGNTWLRYLIAFANFPESEISHSSLSNFLPSIYDEDFISSTQKQGPQQITPPRFIKTHEAFFSLYGKSIYIVRDYRDVAVSTFHYLKNKNLITENISEFIRGDKLNAFGAWSWHVSSAMEWKEKHPEQILIIKYESLLAEPEKELQSILDFCKITSKKSISEIIEAASFANLRKKEIAETKPGEAYFFRKGISGDWKNTLNEKDLAFLLLDKKTNDLMKKLNYI